MQAQFHDDKLIMLSQFHYVLFTINNARNKLHCTGSYPTYVAEKNKHLNGFVKNLCKTWDLGIDFG